MSAAPRIELRGLRQCRAGRFSEALARGTRTGTKPFQARGAKAPGGKIAP